MNMMGVGPLEMLVVLVVAFLVLGPVRMVSTARTIGKVARDLRESLNGIPRSLDDLLDPPDDVDDVDDAAPPDPPGVPRPRRRPRAPGPGEDDDAPPRDC